MDRKDNRFLVVGTGISGIAAASLLVREGFSVILYDGNESLDVERLRRENPQLEQTQVLLGELPKERMAEFDIAVLSPGVPLDLPVVEQMRQEGLQIWGEVELASVFGKGRILAITGTNGKTTTTALLGKIMEHVYEDVQVVGNIGIPYTGIVQDTTDDTVIVAEISSFQLETIHTFCPQVSAILNITPDHLNRHHTMDNYIAAKLGITKNQGEKQACVLNYENEALRAYGETLSTKVLYFSSERKLETGMYLDGDKILYANGIGVYTVCDIHELQIFGKHNYENVMAAAAMAVSFGVSLEAIHDVLVEFQAVEHRIEYVTTKRGVRFYNDSKGTNPDAAIQAVRAMQWPTLLIGGGYDKGSEFDDWIQSFEGKVKKLVLLGETSQTIAKTAKQYGFPDENILFADNLKEAVGLCYANAKSGDAVLLSPACASWGMFKNYEERGDMFKEMVKELEE